MEPVPEADDVAQAMGFSSFGGPSKKRSHDDASPPPQASAPPATLPRRPPAPAAPPKEKNPNWYKRHYDPMSNENPWLALETALGLESTGTWLPSNQKSSH
ncbi:hypothetical protein CP533_4310 [Ophiocordyceps camponoti-saundersi (nom. inval.)]|nr:hypothetical protein CP533_4310 [Ophiocordyceps camponoti-saundersi (nom. inval.)]